MKKLWMILLAVFFLAMVSPVVVFAGEACQGTNCPDLKNDQEQGQKQGQTMIFSPQSNGNRSVGVMPEANTHSVEGGKAFLPAGAYGHPIEAINVGGARVPVIKVIREMTMENFHTFKRVKAKVNGDKVVKKMEKNIIPRPVLTKTFPQTPKIYFVSDLPADSKVDILGILTYDTRKDKKFPVLPQEVLMFCGKDSMEFGANVAIPIDQHFRAYFLPEGFEFSLGGLVSKVFLGGSNPSGASLAPHGGITNQQNTMRGEAGVTFALLRVEDVENIFRPRPVQTVTLVFDPCEEIRKRIRERNSELIKCPNPIQDNAELRYEQSFDSILLYRCTNDETEKDQALVAARDNLKVALRDGAKGQLLKNIYVCLSGTYKEMFERTGKTEYQNEASDYAKKAGLSASPSLIGKEK